NRLTRHDVHHGNHARERRNQCDRWRWIARLTTFENHHLNAFLDPRVDVCVRLQDTSGHTTAYHRAMPRRYLDATECKDRFLERGLFRLHRLDLQILHGDIVKDDGIQGAVVGRVERTRDHKKDKSFTAHEAI